MGIKVFCELEKLIFIDLFSLFFKYYGYLNYVYDIICTFFLGMEKAIAQIIKDVASSRTRLEWNTNVQKLYSCS